MKVQSFHVAKNLNENLIVQVTHSKAFYKYLHQHKEVQISLIVTGNGKLLVGDSIHKFNDGDIFVIGANSPHLFKNEKPQHKVHMISLFFTIDTFGKNFFMLPDLEEVHSFFDIAKGGFQALTNITTMGQMILELNRASKLSRMILFLKLLRILCVVDRKSLTDFVYPKQTKRIAGERLQVVFDHTLHHFQHEIRLSTISDLVYMTPNAFCKFFKQRTNKTYFQFLIELRLEHASQLLLEKRDLSIAQIAELSGFKSISNFNRKFKSTKGVVASQYRLGMISKN